MTTTPAHIQVVVRVRPPNEREKSSPIVMECADTQTIRVRSDDGKSKCYKYDKVYGMDASTQDLMPFVTTLLQHAYSGYNCCMFAYGQTSSGKTHTMLGTPEQPGLIPRICEGLFAQQGSSNPNQKHRYSISVSYYEIYSEKVRDLLVDTKLTKGMPVYGLRIREHPTLGPYVEDLRKVNVIDVTHILELIHVGNSRRVTASTLLNNVSSRSHAIFCINFTQIIADGETGKVIEKTSKINLVDLAGSERIKISGAEGITKEEAIKINQSLLQLGTVIMELNRLSKNGGTVPVNAAVSTSSSTQPRFSISSRTAGPSMVRVNINRSASLGASTHIPYRNSTLTWLLSDSLGGNSRTIMIATISPSWLNIDESTITLRYAYGVKEIVLYARVNENTDNKAVAALETEVIELKKRLASASEAESIRVNEELREKMEQISLECKLRETQVAEAKSLNEQLRQSLEEQRAASAAAQAASAAAQAEIEAVQAAHAASEAAHAAAQAAQEEKARKLAQAHQEELQRTKDNILYEFQVRAMRSELEKSHEAEITKLREEFAAHVSGIETRISLRYESIIAQLESKVVTLSGELETTSVAFNRERIMYRHQIQQLQKKNRRGSADFGVVGTEAEQMSAEFESIHDDHSVSQRSTSRPASRAESRAESHTDSVCVEITEGGDIPPVPDSSPPMPPRSLSIIATAAISPPMPPRSLAIIATTAISPPTTYRSMSHAATSAPTTPRLTMPPLHPQPLYTPPSAPPPIPPPVPPPIPPLPVMPSIPTAPPPIPAYPPAFERAIQRLDQKLDEARRVLGQEFLNSEEVDEVLAVRESLE